jgi:hypothetical protein
VFDANASALSASAEGIAAVTDAEPVLHLGEPPSAPSRRWPNVEHLDAEPLAERVLRHHGRHDALGEPLRRRSLEEAPLVATMRAATLGR